MSLTPLVERSEGDGMDHHTKLATNSLKLATKPAQIRKTGAKLATKKRGPEMLGATRPKSGVVPGGFAPSTRKGDGLGWEEISEQAGRSLRRFIERSQGWGISR